MAREEFAAGSSTPELAGFRGSTHTISRRTGQAVLYGDPRNPMAVVEIAEIMNDRVRVSVSCDHALDVHRFEVAEQIPRGPVSLVSCWRALPSPKAIGGWHRDPPVPPTLAALRQSRCRWPRAPTSESRGKPKSVARITFVRRPALIRLPRPIQFQSCRPALERAAMTSITARIIPRPRKCGAADDRLLGENCTPRPGFTERQFGDARDVASALQSLACSIRFIRDSG
jgi:sRNA-binding carbon storage regulator CsrA